MLKHASVGQGEIPECWFTPGVVSACGNYSGQRWEAYWEGMAGTEPFFREQAKEYARNLVRSLALDPSANVLDFGCGFGFVAELLTSKVARVSLWDNSANMRRHARRKLAGYHNVRFLDLSSSCLVAGDLKFDLILVNSVVQYMSREQFAEYLLVWRSLLAEKGRVVVSDLIPRQYCSVFDLVDLLQFSIRRRVLGSALSQAIRDFGRYSIVRHDCPLARTNVEELNELGSAAGLSVSCLPKNLTLFKRRLTVLFRHEKCLHGRLEG